MCPARAMHNKQPGPSARTRASSVQRPVRVVHDETSVCSQLHVVPRAVGLEAAHGRGRAQDGTEPAVERLDPCRRVVRVPAPSTRHQTPSTIRVNNLQVYPLRFNFLTSTRLTSTSSTVARSSSAASPHVLRAHTGRACGEADQIKKHTHTHTLGKGRRSVLSLSTYSSGVALMPHPPQMPPTVPSGATVLASPAHAA